MRIVYSHEVTLILIVELLSLHSLIAELLSLFGLSPHTFDLTCLVLLRSIAGVLTRYSRAVSNTDGFQLVGKTV